MTFEGIEGSGKTTQIQLLARFLRSKGREVVTTKEPGGTLLGHAIRQWLLTPTEPFSSQYSELLLFYVDRLEHVAKVVQPALEAGKVVLCDRFIDSTIAYQKGGRGMPETLIDTLTWVVPLRPNLTFLLDLSVEEGLKRAKNRAELDRFEHESLAFHTRVRNTYLDQAQKEPDRIKLISVENRSIEEVAEKIQTLLKP